jgi:hypothetical protein
MIPRTRLPWKRCGYPHAQIHFPPLTGEAALLVANLLDRAIAALWRAHGDAMADLLACRDPDAALPGEPDDSPNPTAPAYSSDDDIF